MQGVARAVGDAAAAQVQLQVPCRRIACVEAAPRDDRRRERIVLGIRGHLQAKVAAGGRVAVQYVAEYRGPLLEKVLVAAIGVDALHDRPRLTRPEQAVQGLAETAELRVARVAQPEHGVAQPGQGRALAQRLGEALAVGGRLAITE